jgi:3-deoxy-D-manno-octulosonate 8-phosphate phosphatase (KDO 8-P phosphatase)
MLDKMKAVAMDLDSVLTDGTFWWDQNEIELKRFRFADITGIPLAQKAGIILAIISGESSDAGKAIVTRYAKKVNIKTVYKGCHGKASALREFAEKNKLDLSEVCFMGDDINDLPAIEISGFSVAPPNAHSAVLRRVNFVTKHRGGSGAVRELIDMIIELRTKNT